MHKNASFRICYHHVNIDIPCTSPPGCSLPSGAPLGGKKLMAWMLCHDQNRACHDIIHKIQHQKEKI